MAQTFGQSFHQGAWVLHMIFLMHKMASSQVSYIDAITDTHMSSTSSEA